MKLHIYLSPTQMNLLSHARTCLFQCFFNAALKLPYKLKKLQACHGTLVFLPKSPLIGHLGCFQLVAINIAFVFVYIELHCLSLTFFENLH